MKQLKTYYIIDFDSTIIEVEGHDLLAKIVLKDHPDFQDVAKQIANITRLGMEGKIGFAQF